MNAPQKPQFTLKTIMIAMAVVCFLCAFFFAFPPWLRLFLFRFIEVALAGLIAAMVIYGRDSMRAFGIGAALPVVFNFLATEGSPTYIGAAYYAGESVFGQLGLALGMIMHIVSTATSGAVCVLGRRWILARQSLGSSVHPPVSTTVDNESSGSAPPVQRDVQ